HLANTQLIEYFRQPLQFLPRENFVMVAIIFRVGRAAIHTPEVAPVRHGNPQVRNLPPEFVLQAHLAPKNKKPDSQSGIGCSSKICIFGDALLSILREAQPFPAKPSAQIFLGHRPGSHRISLPPGSSVGVSDPSVRLAWLEPQ